MSAPLQIGLLVFPKGDPTRFDRPLQVFASIPGAQVHLIWKRIEPVPSDSVLTLTPNRQLCGLPAARRDLRARRRRAPTDMVNDEEMLEFLRQQATGAKYITSVCTGSLVLGAAGLLRGYRATTHWASMDYLAPYGATPTRTRVCVDRNRVSGGGVTAGIDFALTLVSIWSTARPRRLFSCGSNIIRAAVQCRLARYRAAGNFSRARNSGSHRPATPRRGKPPGRGAPRLIIRIARS